MAAAKKNVPARRSTTSRAVTKAKARVSAMARSRAAERKTRAQETAVLLGGGGLGLIERMAIDLPSIPGVPDAVTYGVGTYLIGDRMVSGKAGDMLRSAGVGMLACALRDLVSGRTRLGAAEDLDASAFDDLDLAA